MPLSNMVVLDTDLVDPETQSPSSRFLVLRKKVSVALCTLRSDGGCILQLPIQLRHLNPYSTQGTKGASEIMVSDIHIRHRKRMDR